VDGIYRILKLTVFFWNIAHHALTSIIETQVMYAIRSISYMMEHELSIMEVKKEAAEEFLELLDKKIERTIFTTKILPKFLNSKGQCRGFWWGSCTEFWWRMRDLHPERFLTVAREDGKARGQLNGGHLHLNGESRGEDMSVEL
jgi:hypothetical protein